MSVTRKDQHTLDNGVVAGSLHPLLPQLRLPWEYSVLAACMDPDDRGRTHVLVQTHQPTSYVVYRVDTTDGSCHGGRYVGNDLPRALQVFGEYLQTLTLAVAARPAGGADAGIRINGVPATAADVVALGRAMDAEDGGYPQPGSGQ